MTRRTIAIAIAALGLAVLVWAAFTFRRPIEREWRLWQFARAEGEAKKAIADRLVALGAITPVEDWYLQLLASEDVNARAVAVGELGAMRSERAVPALIALFGRVDLRGFILSEEVVRVREALAQIGAPAVPALIAELRAGSGLSGTEAQEVLERLGLELTGTALLDVLRSRGDAGKDEYAAVAAIQLIRGREVGTGHDRSPPGAVPLLVECLGDQSDAVREEASDVLISWHAVEAAPALADTLGHPRAAARGSAAWILLRLEEDLGETIAADEGVLVTALSDGDADVRRAAAMVLGRLEGASEAARGALLATAADDEEHRVRHAAVLSAARHGPVPERVVIGLVDDVGRTGDADLDAFLVLGELGPKAVPGLLAAIASQEENRREHAVAVFGLLPPDAERAAAPRLAELAASGPLEVKRAAIWALGRYDYERETAAAALVAACDDDDADVRATALSALAYLGGSAGAVSAVAARLDDPDVAVRRAAAEVLAAVGPEAAATVPALARLLDDADDQTRARAAFALARVAGPAAGEAGEVVPLLVRLLAGDEFLERRRAALALAAIGPAAAAAEPALVLAAGDEYAGVREAAAAALERIRGARGE